MPNYVMMRCTPAFFTFLPITHLSYFILCLSRNLILFSLSTHNLWQMFVPRDKMSLQSSEIKFRYLYLCVILFFPILGGFFSYYHQHPDVLNVLQNLVNPDVKNYVITFNCEFPLLQKFVLNKISLV
jgi:hypothetical protein